MAENIGVYDNPDALYGVTVMRVENRERDIQKYAPIIQGIMLAAYWRRFELRDRVLSDGQIAAYLADPTNPEMLKSQAERMSESIENGSTYVAIHLGRPGSLGEVAAIGKSSPSVPRSARLASKMRLQKEVRPNCYVNDLASSRVGRGAGSTALYALLGEYDADREVVLDAFGRRTDDKPENQWFRSLGLTAKGKTKHPLKIGEQVLDQFRMGGASVGEVRHALVQRRPWLAEPKSS